MPDSVGFLLVRIDLSGDAERFRVSTLYILLAELDRDGPRSRRRSRWA